ncbi:MAG: N-6 DNA methylase [Verrucomicrobia bacterium]|jgi:hypothetical protein|nr:N-6 DNA methylase [Verrucomicrobiota bacterium]
MPTAPDDKLQALIDHCSFETAQACFRRLCPGSFERTDTPLENANPERFGGIRQFGELKFDKRSVLFAYTEVADALTERSARKDQFEAARAILKNQPATDAGIFIFRGTSGAFRLSLISKIYKGSKAEFSHFRRYTYFVDPHASGHHTFIKQVGGCAFDSLEAIQEAFSVEAINKDFYKELSNWYFWAMKHVHFPTDDVGLNKKDLLADKQKVREHDAKNLIRLLTRLLFVWFIKQRNLVPHELFDPEAIARDYLEGFDPESRDTRYYKAILQNFFFAALNQTKGERGFRRQGSDHRDNTSMMRYKALLKDPDQLVAAVEAVTPFLNGGLFECLDFLHPTEVGPRGGKKKIYEDGFSDREDNPLVVPDFLFFGGASTQDLSDDYGDTKRKKEPVQGLIHILNRYNFTIVENTPIEQEVALDPELLGKVFENLLASYNPETQTTARKQTGSFYTPRSIVDYMVDESLKAYLLKPLTNEAGMVEGDARAGLDLLFSYEEEDKESIFEPEQVDVLIRAIDQCKILDPACGSGAFPMGILQKLVHILSKLDPDNAKWEQRQIDEAQNIEDTQERRDRIREIMNDFEDNDDDYGRKLYLIENCLYGVDIQSIATQVSKLRFFISLVVDQKIDRAKDNFGVRPLPNLETKFVTADTLIAAEQPEAQAQLSELTEVQKLKNALQDVRHKIFSVQTTKAKQGHKETDARLREQIAAELKANGWPDDSADRLAKWDPYKQNESANFFDPEWMFGLKGFDVVIGNPPYIQIQKFPKEQKDQWAAQNYSTYAATADIYCLFYERGADLLNTGGQLAYITSNKWMRAGYGEKLRGYLADKVDTHTVLDFGMAQNFGAATTYTCITQFAKDTPRQQLRTCYASDDRAAMRDPGAYFQANAVCQNELSALPWVILTPERHAIKKKVEAQGIPLAEWDIEINYGIKTGFNDAFYITTEQRDAFVAADPKCADYLVPLLRGRYVQRYSTNWDGTWMINSHNGVKSKGIPPVDLKKECPVLWEHVKQFEPQLIKRQDKGEHWSNLRNCVYLKEFLKPKIILQEIAVTLPFYYDNSASMFMDTTCFMITSEREALPHLTAVMNSKLFRFCFRDNFPEYSGNACRMKKIFIDKIPIKKPTPPEAALFEKLVPLVQFIKKSGADIPVCDPPSPKNTKTNTPTNTPTNTDRNVCATLIDACVMECYFRDHMAERGLLLQDDVASALASYNPEAPEAEQLRFIQTLHQRLTAANIPERFQRIPEASPDLLGVILKEGQV